MLLVFYFKASSLLAYFIDKNFLNLFKDDDGDDEEENCYIPQEVVLEYQCQREKVQKQRIQLRETLRENFERLCVEKRRSLAPDTNDKL